MASRGILVSAIISIFVLVFLTLWTYAAEVMPSSDSRCSAVISGEIEEGDYRRVIEGLRGADSPVVCMDSIGGSFLGGLELNELFLSEGIGTYLRRTDECYSACAIAFLGGSVWGDFRHVSRVMEPGAVLGFHAPYLVPPSGSYDEADIAEIARTTVLVIRQLISEQESLKVSDAFVLDFLLDVSPETRKIETVGDLAHSGVDLAGYSYDGEFMEIDFRRACSLVFSVYSTNFSDAGTAWEPLFQVVESEFSHLLPLLQLDHEGELWKTVSMQHDWGTPWQTASCAFGNTSDQQDYVPVIFWSNGVGDAPDIHSAVRSFRIDIPQWYFLGQDFRLADIQAFTDD